MQANFPLVPGTTLGLLGGGQLGRMFAQAAARMGYKVKVLAKGDCPAAEVSAYHIDAGYSNKEAIEELRQTCPAVTTEFENVPAQVLSALAQGGACVTAPEGSAVAVAQDRIDEKAFLESVADVPVAPHAAILSLEDADSVSPDLLPGILKTARMGYDGKGQRTVRTIADIKAAFTEMGSRVCILEKRLELAKEVSVIVVRSLTGETVTYPLFENVHRNGILAETVFPARVTGEVSTQVRQYAARIAETLQYKGVLCIEFFVLKDGTVSANEMAPRPHNSGHVTIEAAVTSQFEQQVRAMAGLPLGDTSALCHGVMLNLLGDLWFDENDNRREPNWAALLKIEGAKLHLYGKAEARHARKMGHVTIVAPTQEEALSRAKRAAAVLGLPEPM